MVEANSRQLGSGLGSTLDGALVRLFRPLMASSSPAYIEALPNQLPATDLRPEFIKFEADKTAIGPFPRFWKNVGLSAIPADVLEEIQDQHPDLNPALAYLTYQHNLDVKQLPGGFAEDPYILGTYVVGARIGPRVLNIKPGLWAPGHPFVGLPGARRHPEGVRHVDGLANRFAGQQVFI